MRPADAGGQGAGTGVPRGVGGLRAGLEEAELLLFEWVWGQKLKSSPAGGQLSLFGGVLHLFTSKAAEKGTVSTGPRSVSRGTLFKGISLYNAPGTVLGTVGPFCNFILPSLNA